MTGSGKATRKREQAIVALLEQPTITTAAQVVGVSERTLRRWLAEADFAASYRLARRQVVDVAIGGLQQATAEAVAALRRNLTADAPQAVQVRAALGILEQAAKGAELLDLAERVAALEAKEPPPWT